MYSGTCLLRPPKGCCQVVLIAQVVFIARSSNLTLNSDLNGSFLAHLWCAYAMVLCLSWIVRRAVGGVCVEHNYPKMWMD